MKVWHFSWAILLYLQVVLARQEWVDREDWVDPHDMKIGMRHRKKSHHESYNKDESCNHINSYLRKFVNLVVNMAKFDSNSQIYKGQMNILLSIEDYDFLRDFDWNEKIDHISLRRLDYVLENSVQYSFYDSAMFTIGEYIYLKIFNEYTLLVLGLLCLLLVLWKLEPHNYRLYTLFKIFIPLVYVSDFVLRYLALIEEVEVEKYLEFKDKHEYCDPEKMGYLFWFYDKWTGYCQKNEKARLLSQRAAIHIITPMKVVAEQVAIVVPIMQHIGHGCGSFMWAVIDDVPWYVKPFVAILALFVLVILILMAGSSILGVSPRLNILHIFQIEFWRDSHSIRNQGSDNQNDRVTGENLRLLLKIQSKNSDNLNLDLGSSSSKSDSFSFKTKSKSKQFSKLNSRTRKKSGEVKKTPPKHPICAEIQNGHTNQTEGPNNGEEKIIPNDETNEDIDAEQSDNEELVYHSNIFCENIEIIEFID